MRCRTLAVLAVMLAAASVSAAPKESGADDPGLRIGLVFCASAIPISAEAYEGGIGAQVSYGKLLGRAGAHFLFDDRGADPQEFGWGLSLMGGYRLTGGIARLHVGAFAEYSRLEEKTVVDDDDWTKTIESTLGFGPLVGVEFRILDNLSLFLDYELAFDFVFPSEVVSAAGTVTKNDEDVERLFETRLGNSGLVGICIYFK